MFLHACFSGLILLAPLVLAEPNDAAISLLAENVRAINTTGKILDAIGNITTITSVYDKNIIVYPLVTKQQPNLSDYYQNNLEIFSNVPSTNLAQNAEVLTVTKNIIAAEKYKCTNVVKSNPKLIPENIKKGVTIFGVVGTFTGITPIQNALIPSRYTNKNNGTVIDNRTKLIWLRNASCFNHKYWNQIEQNSKVFVSHNESIMQDWKTATRIVNELQDGQCGLNDGSKPTDWRLPTKEEWEVMVDTKYERPALSNTNGTGQWAENDIFRGVKTSYYWSSTTFVGNASLAWYMTFSVGSTGFVGKNSAFYVWPIRDEH